METIDNENYYPMLISEIASKADSKEVFLAKWKQYDTISENLKLLLTSRELPFLIRAIAKKHNLTDLNIANLSRNIRKLFFRELSEEAFSENISNILGGDEKNGKVILLAIKNLKISNYPLYINEPDVENLTLNEALIKYPQLYNNLITSDYLKFPNSNKKIIPTLRNWLNLYDQEVGVKSQTTVQRGKFLYSSKNCSKLSETKRNLIAKILQSRDENTKLALNKKTQQILIKNDTDSNDYKSLISKTVITPGIKYTH